MRYETISTRQLLEVEHWQHTQMCNIHYYYAYSIYSSTGI